MSGPSVSWSTPLAAVVATAVGTLALTVTAVTLSTDTPGRVIIGVAAVGLAVLTIVAAVRRPRLALSTADGPELIVRGLFGSSSYRRPDIIRVRLTETKRLGRTNAMLELDVVDNSVERLLVFTRWDLGTSPQIVYETLSVHGLTAS